MQLTTVYTDHVFNQGYHISFNGILRQEEYRDIVSYFSVNINVICIRFCVR